MKHSLQLRLSQHLTLTPQLQQSIRLLQLSTIELNQEVERILQENPLLQRSDEDDGGSAPPPPDAAAPSEAPRDTAERQEPEQPAPEDSGASALTSLDDEASAFGSRDDDDDREQPQAAADMPSLRDHLLGQVSLTGLSDRDRQIVSFLIHTLDEGGFLTQPLEELQEMLPEEYGVDADDLAIALKHVQHLDPPGVGARNLSECLALQLKALPPGTPHVAEALTVVTSHLEALATRDFARLKRALDCDDVALRAVQRLITGLNPRPGARYGSDETRFVIPDVIVKKVKGVWLASLNADAMPKLRVNRMYAQILARNRDASMQSLASQLQEAKWLIKNVQQRFETILRVSQAIVDRQRHFFEHGEVAMRPLVLREIADILDLHESTVSRVTTQKFMLTPRGLFELKYFFGSHVATETGGACSATAIRALIRQLVGAENSRKPLSDSQISGILGQQGIVVARRTVAKYRESLQILPVNLRKSI